MDPSQFPVTVSPTTVGAFAFAIPFVVMVVVQGIKGLFYQLAPNKWKAWLPDKWTWPALAATGCVGTTVALSIDIGGRLFGEDWPDLPPTISYVMSGAALAALSSKVLYPLMIEPREKQKALAAVAKACAPETVEPPKAPPTLEPTPPPQPEPQPEPEYEAGPEPVSIPAGVGVSARLLTRWPVRHDGPEYILVDREGKQLVLTVKDEGESPS